MIQYCDQVCCSRARKYGSHECTSLLRHFKERAAPALGQTQARLSTGRESQLSYRREPVAVRAAEVRTRDETRCAKEMICPGKGLKHSDLLQ